jgi:hypothetical protein
MDQLIIIYSGIFFTIFYLLHLICIRILPSRAVFHWALAVLIISGSVSTAVYFFMPLNFNGFNPPVIRLFILLMSLLISTSVSLGYLFTVFGTILESSIKMKLLKMITDSGSAGVTQSKILQKYNAETIINKRLDRLVASDTLQRVKKTYTLKHRSPIMDTFYLLISAVKFCYKLP